MDKQKKTHKRFCLVRERLEAERQRNGIEVRPDPPPRMVTLAHHQQMRLLTKSVSFLETVADPGDTKLVRIFNALEGIGVFSISDLLHLDRERFQGVANLGDRSLEHLLTLLERLGFYSADRRAELERETREYNRLRSRISI